MKAKTFKFISFPIITIILAALIALNGFCVSFAPSLSLWLCGYKTNVSSEQLQATREKGEKLAEQIESEGIVMVKNNGVLPLSKTTDDTVNVFGWSASQWIAGGSGSGRVVNKSENFSADTGLLEALNLYGIEYNTALIDMYKNYQDERPYLKAGTLFTFPYEYSRLYEPDINDTKYYSSAILNDAQMYSNTAIVVIGRVSGESNDSPKVQYKGVNGSSAASVDNSRTYLEISTEEENLLTFVGQNFEKVIVIINSTNTMELSFMDTIQGLDACLIVGGTGINAATAIPKVLYGDINPSGRTADTYAYDLSTNSSYTTSGLNGISYYTNGNGLYPADGTTNGNESSSVKYDGVSYIDYIEGIYVGYKWYETAYTEGYWESVSNSYGTGYKGIVQYPFGYGLSYTEFQWEIIKLSQSANSALSKNDSIEITVRVTNTGSHSGQDVVELYYNPPYYKDGIEKSSSNLCAFGKTDILKPDEYQDIILSFKVEDMASYDCYDKNNNNFCGYELDSGKYEISLMKNAHETGNVINSSKSAYGTATINYSIGENIRYETDSESGKKVTNKFTGESALDGVSADGINSDSNITYLSRSNFDDTFPKALANARAMTDNVKALNLYTEDIADAWKKSDDTEIVTGANNGLSVYNSDGITALGLELGADYNNSTWDSLLDQMTISEMKNLVLHGYIQTKGVSSIGKPLTMEVDGPSQIGSFNRGELHGTGFPTPTVIAQTWNAKLAYNFGLAVGDEAGKLGYDGWYAPGVNIHRSPFGGRNYEYYSEDGLLSGIMSANTIKGSKNTGVYCYIKHLALYDQESNRDGLYTWLTEQSLREIYLKPFKIAIDAGTTGIMTAYNRIGAVWTGGSYALITGIVRDEWGFKGAVLSDYADHHKYMNMDQALRAGGDIWMDGWGDTGKFLFETSSNSYNQALRRASKNIIYMWLNALYTNSQYNMSDDVEPIIKGTKTEVFPWWIPVLIGIDIIALGGCTFWAFKAYKKKDKTTLPQNNK